MDTKLDLKKDGPIWIPEKIEKLLQQIYDHFRSLNSQNDYLREENSRLKSEAYKDEKLSKMKSEYERMKSAYFRGFPISEEEEKKINDWIKEICDKYPGNAGAIGGRFTYKFTPTGVGTFGTIVDSFSNEKLTFQEP